jgi:DNA/RNA endonuclease G (NUC1)
MKKINIILLLLLFSTSNLNEDIIFIEKKIYTVKYSQKLEQPLEITYRSINRKSKVKNKNLNFYLEKGVHTSSNADYHNNIYDKGHLVPAGSFSDNISNLRETYSFLNCSLQHQDLNRGEWRLVEEQERIWDNYEPLTVKIEVLFDENSVKLSSGATVPSGYVKHIYFENSKKHMCFYFKNEKPKLKWYKHKINCENDKL